MRIILSFLSEDLGLIATYIYKQTGCFVYMYLIYRQLQVRKWSSKCIALHTFCDKL